MGDKPQAQSTNASAFRDRAKKYEEGELLQLSSGPTVRVRRPSISVLIREGKIPASLAAATVRFDTGRDVSDRDVQRLYELRLLVAEHALISPKLVKEPDYDKDEISIRDLADDDISEIYQYVQVGLEALNKFRASGQGVSAGPDSSEVSGDTA